MESDLPTTEEINRQLVLWGYAFLPVVFSDYVAPLEAFLNNIFNKGYDISVQTDGSRYKNWETERQVFSNLHVLFGDHDPLLELMKSPVMKVIRAGIKQYLGERLLVSDYLYQVSPVGGERILKWHSDISDLAICPQQRRVKVFIYLNDVDDANGAFSYVPESHTHSLDLRPLAKANGFKQLLQIEDFCEAAKVVGGTRPADFFDALEISGVDDPTNEFSFCGRAGTAILFDEIGIHAGGVVKQGSRHIFRIGFKRESAYWRHSGVKSSLPRSILSRLPFIKDIF